VEVAVVPALTCPHSSERHALVNYTEKALRASSVTLHAVSPPPPHTHTLQDNLNSPEGLEGVERRFVAFNGGVSKQQLGWLDQQLLAARQAGQLVLVASHLPVAPDTCPPACLVWNYDEVLSVLRRHAGVVVGSMAGHSHQNGYVLDGWGLHHVVLPGVVETPPGRGCAGALHLHAYGCELRGSDTMMSMHMPCKPGS